MAAVEKRQEAKPSKLKKPSYRQEYRQEKKTYLVLPPISYGIKKAMA